MANLPDFSDLNLTKGGFYTLVNELRTYLNDSIGAVGSPEGAKLTLGLDSVDNTSDLSKPISNATQTALNAKQATLVSGTNIKTINSTSLLTSGNINLQATLVSGTNIRTINGTSLLGSGNIDTPTVTLSSAIDSDSETEAATPLAVKTINDTKIGAYSYSAGSKSILQYLIKSNNATTVHYTLNAPPSTRSSTMVKAFETVINGSGTVTVVFSLTSSSSTAYSTDGQIYVNDVAVGTYRVNTKSNNTTLTFSENISVNYGDRIAIYFRAYDLNQSFSAGIVSNFDIRVADFNEKISLTYVANNYNNTVQNNIV